MFTCVRQPACAGLASLVAVGIWAVAPASADRLSMRINGLSNPPVGYVEFCRTFPAECEAQGGEAAERLSDQRWRDLQEVNAFVNHLVAPATDLDYYGREEVWALPETYGDCEDYVLLKRKWLIERGWSTGALLVTVAFDEVGDGHAVLLARTGHGDFVLDNKTDAIRPWHETSYRFVKRQSVSDPNRWVSVGDPRWTTRSTAASR